MSETPGEVRLEDGTLIRHKVIGYEGRIDGITALKTCFTRGGLAIVDPKSKEAFEYRVLVEGEIMRRIAPAEDLEVLEGVTEITCSGCKVSFRSKPGYANKPGGRCQCGGWICPFCLTCQGTVGCVKQRQRLARKLGVKKKLRPIAITGEKK